MPGVVAQVASYHGTTVKFTELLRATHPLTNAWLHTPVLMEVMQRLN